MWNYKVLPNDRALEISCVDADEGDESNEDPQVMINEINRNRDSLLH